MHELFETSQTYKWMIGNREWKWMQKSRKQKVENTK